MTHLTQNAPLTGTVSKVVATCAPTLELGLFQRIFGVWRQRQHLDRLPAHMRRDIGLSDGQIAQEVARPLWDAPQTWRL
jgi:hypothetical protein